MSAESITVNMTPGNALCLLYGHDYGKDGVCHRKLPSLEGPKDTKDWGECGAQLPIGFGGGTE